MKAFLAVLVVTLSAFAVRAEPAQIGPRAAWLVDQMDEGPLKAELAQCLAGPFERSRFSIGHRGAALQFPEHTRESYVAAARMGAGIVECDVTFTEDRELVCRHSQCDLHTTTNILAIPALAATCRQPFSPADPATGAKATAECCASDITLAEFRQLTAKMDAADRNATTLEGYMNATAPWRTDLYAGTGTLLTHAESIALLDGLGVDFTPELKAPAVAMPFQGEYGQRDYAQALIDEYKAAGIEPGRVFAQSFDLDDVRYWIAAEPDFGAQAVYLDGRYGDDGFDVIDPSSWQPGMDELAAEGVNILAPPLWMLLALDGEQRMVPSAYAGAAKAAGLDLIAWTLERSGPLAGGGGWYYQSVKPAIDGDGDLFAALDVLGREVGVRGVFSDWPATTTFYANCMGLE
ncbi:MAG: glycerophosphodiester phosphodiesterase [Inquilinus sp.]|nr:glycerophosphodiester phosphodiesterase [Inquilinus sp.]